MSATFTAADVLAWARTKPADETYCYTDPGNCALCQFLRDTGRALEPRVAPPAWREGVLSKDRLPYPVALEDPLALSDTFGELVERLEKLVPPSPWLDPQTYLDADCGKVPA